VRTKLIEAYQEAFKKYDVLVGPTSPTTAFKLGEKQEPLSMYLSDVMTVSASLVGIPAISVPAGMAEGLPVGIQIMAAQGREKRMFTAAAAVQKLTGEAA
jgi:aspartyl-tRNA(Asn)/glutamyl-tRNA(Gln) amidotransferase subunit A